MSRFCDVYSGKIICIFVDALSFKEEIHEPS